MQRNRGTELRVGLFVFVALAIGGTLVFVIGNQRNMFRSKTTYYAVFDQVGGLRSGSTVRISGLSVGLVSDVQLEENGKIRVELDVVDTATSLLREDSVVSIVNKGLLGDKLVDISVGQGAVAPANSTLLSESPRDLGEYFEQASGLIENAEATLQNLRTATEPLGEEQFATDLREITHSLATLTHMAAEGDGAVQRLLTDRQLADRLHQTITNVETTSSELAATSRSFRAIADEVRSGDGSAHRLIYGEEGARLVENLAEVSGEAAIAMRDIRTGDGLAHGLIYGDDGGDLMENATAISTDLRAIIAEVRAGHGTLGGLLVDPSIYEDVKRLVGDLQRNEILRALVRYSIRQDESHRPATVTPRE